MRRRQRNGQLDRAEIGAEVAPRPTDILKNGAPNLGGQFLELFWDL